MRKLINQLIADRSGATAVEYGLILSLVFLAMIGAVSTAGNEIIETWDEVSETSSEAMANAGV